MRKNKSRRLVHEKDSDSVVELRVRNYYKYDLNHPMPVRIIRHSSVTVSIDLPVKFWSVTPEPFKPLLSGNVNC